MDESTGHQSLNNRNNNGPYLSVRDALELFVSRREFASFVQTIQEKLDSIVSRSEHEQRWKNEDERYERLSSDVALQTKVLTAQIAEQSKILTEIKDARFRWVLPALTVIMPLLTGVAIWWLSRPPH